MAKYWQFIWKDSGKLSFLERVVVTEVSWTSSNVLIWIADVMMSLSCSCYHVVSSSNANWWLIQAIWWKRPVKSSSKLNLYLKKRLSWANTVGSEILELYHGRMELNLLYLPEAWRRPHGGEDIFNFIFHSELIPPSPCLYFAGSLLIWHKCAGF